MKIYKVYQTSARYGDSSSVDENFYSSYDVAKKYFDLEVQFVKNNDEFSKYINEEREDYISYSDGYKWTYSCGIEEVEVKDR